MTYFDTLYSIVRDAGGILYAMGVFGFIYFCGMVAQREEAKEGRRGFEVVGKDEVKG